MLFTKYAFNIYVWTGFGIHLEVLVYHKTQPTYLTQQRSILSAGAVQYADCTTVEE